MFDKFFRFFWKKPEFALCFSFLVSIFIGTLLLMLPWASAAGKWTSFIDALFTATSGVCVTGLIVKDTATYWSTFGHIVILILIQLGGLGIMTAGAFFFSFIGEGLGDSHQKDAIKDVLKTKLPEAKQVIRFAVIATLTFEIIGFFFLLPHQTPFQALFHSISAFCNAGFSLNSTSFIGYQSNLPFNLTISNLIIFGGFGFLVLKNLRDVCFSWLKRKEKIKKKINLHSKLVIIGSLILILVGTLVFLTLEAGNLSNLPFGTRLLVSFFQSVTARTAGFNTTDIANVGPATKLLLMFLMFVGGAPTSTAGGVKITTFILFVLTFFSLLKGKENIEVFGRTIPWQTVRKAISIILVSVAVLFVFCLILLILENAKFENILFEAFSAFGTVGLTTGITPQLTGLGKLVITILMYIGRLGPLTFFFLLSKGKRAPKKGYPEGKVAVG